jgi:hypothetical protein
MRMPGNPDNPPPRAKPPPDRKTGRQNKNRKKTTQTTQHQVPASHLHWQISPYLPPKPSISPLRALAIMASRPCPSPNTMLTCLTGQPFIEKEVTLMHDEEGRFIPQPDDHISFADSPQRDVLSDGCDPAPKGPVWSAAAPGILMA